MIYTTVIFYIGDKSVELPAPRPGYQGRHERVQGVGQTADGTRFVYDKNVTNRTLTLRFHLDATQRDALISWFDTHAHGRLNTFTYRDHMGVGHADCRLLSDIEWAKGNDALYDVELEIVTGDDAR